MFKLEEEKFFQEQSSTDHRTSKRSTKTSKSFSKRNKSNSAKKLYEDMATLNKQFLLENEKMKLILKVLENKKVRKEGRKEWRIEMTSYFKKFLQRS